MGKRLALKVIVALALISIYEQLQLIERFARINTNEDQTLLWAAARDWGELKFRQPNFWGQTYGTTFEGVPVAIGGALGISPTVALPLTLTLMGLSIWWLVALGAWWGRNPTLGVAAAAAPIVLTTRESLMVDIYGAGIGRFLGGAAVALAVAKFKGDWTLGAMACIGGFAILFDAAAALVVAPAALWLLVTPTGFWRRRIAWCAAGAVPVMGWVVFCAAFYNTHPDYAFHLAPRIDPSLERLPKTLANSGEYFSPATLEIWQWWVIPVALGIVALGTTIKSRKWRSWLPASVAVLGILGILSTSRAFNGYESIYLARSRILLILPLVLWFLWFLAAQTTRTSPSRRARVVGCVIIALVVISVPYRSMHLDAELAAESRVAFATGGFPIITVDELEHQCGRASLAARLAGTDLAIFYTAGVDRNLAYGCASLISDFPDTLFPSYERRTWRLHSESNNTRTSMLVWRPNYGFCANVRGNPRISECTETGGPPGEAGYAVVRFPPSSSLAVLAEFGLEPRSFDNT